MREGTTVASQEHENEPRLEAARKKLLGMLEDLRASGTLTQKECDAVEAAIEDELIALRVSPLLGRDLSGNKKPR
jgi:hypothetical protein